MPTDKLDAWRCATAGHLVLTDTNAPKPQTCDAPVYPPGRSAERRPCGCTVLTPFELDRRKR